jgi:hypothetical protein
MVKTSPFSFHEFVWSGRSSPLAFDFDVVVEFDPDIDFDREARGLQPPR